MPTLRRLPFFFSRKRTERDLYLSSILFSLFLFNYHQVCASLLLAKKIPETELLRYGGQSDLEVKNYSTHDAKQGGAPANTSVDTFVPPGTSFPHSDGYHGLQPQRLSNVIPKTGQRPAHKWKGPDKISKIYGDWIDDL